MVDRGEVDFKLADEDDLYEVEVVLDYAQETEDVSTAKCHRLSWCRLTNMICKTIVLKRLFLSTVGTPSHEFASQIFYRRKTKKKRVLTNGFDLPKIDR